MRKRLILPLLFAAACDGGSGPAGGAELTAAEAAELSRAMFSMASDLANAGLSGAGFNLAPRQAQNGFTVPIEETVPCSPSGSTDIEGTVTVGFDDVTMGISMEADVSAAPQSCAHRLENGDVIEVTGDPDLDIHLVMAGNAEALTALQVTETGAFRWTRGSASGRCSVNLASSLDAPTQMVTVSGTFCGFPVAETFPIDG